MSTGLVAGGLLSADEQRELNTQWRWLRRAATAVAILTSPALFVWFHKHSGWPIGWSIFATLLSLAAFRGALDLIFHRFIRWPSLFGIDSQELREEDVVARRRVWFWHFWAKVVYALALVVLFVYLINVLKNGAADTSFIDSARNTFTWFWDHIVTSKSFWTQVAILPLFFLINFVILFGPLMAMGVSQIRGFEPGDADWGVKLDDVRGQAEAKEEVRRVVSLWQSGEAFEQAGGKRERGLLFLGAPGTGKTMLAKAIATGFNSPIVTVPGSGFAQTFLGMDAIIVRFMARKAKKLARKWGGQCIIFIDEIDAVGTRRQSLGGASSMSPKPQSFHDLCFFGPNGALTGSEDLVLESRAWRERVFAEREPEKPSRNGILNQGVFGGMMGGGGGLALNQLLVVMDGIDNPPFFRRMITNRTNTLLDALYVVPRRVRGVSLRLPHTRPGTSQIYFVGATNVPMEVLDPALTRPGRMGRHVWFRTPTKNDRLDIFDLYLTKVSHEEDLNTAKRRDELARVTNGYSPAMIEQVCSMALTIAHHDGRLAFGWQDIVEAMTTVESGTAIGTEYVPKETRAIAIHEAGHAATAHHYMEGAESTRLSIKRRGAALGHHQAREKEERFSSWRSEEMAQLIWALGAMAAERVFYGENSTGVGGDVQGATARAAWMVGACGMAPEQVDLASTNGRATKKTLDQKRDVISQRLQQIGTQIMNRTGDGGVLGHDPLAGVLNDRDKRAFAAQLLGQAYVTAHAFILENKAAVEKIADELIEKRELFGDELVQILESAKLKAPQIDLTKEAAWPVL
ncbi:MAG: AAA family ATPase [Actinobacteria bacterium]|nr:MAG: AAA family ATPase [Actinomycetota bacterium]